MVQHVFFLALALLSHTNVFAQEYTYDVNGNLISDGNKEIASIHYNHLNLVDTIVYADGRKMIYTFTASGQKLREQSILANGTIKQKRDYSGTILYRNDSLQEIKHEDGRIIPGDEAEYQYHLTDHLGNVRTTLTSNQEVDNSTATYEAIHAATEQSKYLRYTVARRVNTPLFDHTHNGATFYSERLNGSANEKYGIARSLSVMPGDTIKLEVFAKYVEHAEANQWTTALTTLLTQITAGTAPVGTVVDGANYATNGTTPFPFAGLNNTANSTGAGPRAYLNWLVFDRNFVLKTGGYVKMTDAAKENGTNVAHERLFTQFTIKEAGYVYVYLSNEETTPKEVYFDDLSVTQVKGPIVQESDYDPFGLTFNEFSREKATPNNFLYNGKELQNDFELNWYDYGARMYDAALGRWHVIDPMAEKYAGWSPYNYVLNNPLKFIDPDGQNVRAIVDIDPKTNEKKLTIEGNYYTNSDHEFKHLSAGLKVWNDFSGKHKIEFKGEVYKLYFNLKAIQLSEPESAYEFSTEKDPIGNSYEERPPAEAKIDGDDMFGITAARNIDFSKFDFPFHGHPKASEKFALAVARSIGHTFMLAGEMKGGTEEVIARRSNRISVVGTIMDRYNGWDYPRLNKKVVENISATLEILSNPYNHYKRNPPHIHPRAFFTHKNHNYFPVIYTPDKP